MSYALNLDLPELEWVQLLHAERAKGKSVSQIARECDMARPSVSMLLNGTYPAQSLDLVTRKHGAKVVQMYRDQVLCPYLHKGIATEECQAFATMPMSTSSPEKLRHWGACRRCAQNPVTPGGKANV
ncbi:MarR family transcriptional regulator [Pseudooceanicola spongiae]|jgi:hypothetical protein|uniref:Uncharacterized protein n=1 Tax=Pseudooceanicola spongiae TaxID=2613965 RepID=A0A7L9WKL2_9RHOB|nr:helix-turn-helix domain-containing protein [Pseudooceanicola spongiae]QOL80433.1 hypothetical protein F3W81_06165 [Pseudooceanicola spongiae]